MVQHPPADDAVDGDAPLRDAAGRVRRFRTPEPVILSAVELPLTAERRERAVAALSQLLTAWWQRREHQ
jgi:hypothetical protein